MWEWEPSFYQHTAHGVKYDCDCRWQDDLRRHYLLAGIPLDYWTISAADFFGDPKALGAALEYLAKWPEHKWHGTGIRFYAPALGVGKTTLATLIARELIQRKVKVQFMSFYDTLGLYEMPYEQREMMVRRLRNITVLVLDEVGVGFTETQREYFASELEGLIRARTSGNAITIITTNMLEERLEEVYPRTFSLLAHKQLAIEVGPLANGGTDARKSGRRKLFTRPIV